MVARLNHLDGQLCRAMGMPRAGDATTLDEAITMSTTTTDQFLSGPRGSAEARSTLAACLQQQVEARQMRAADRIGAVRSLTAVIRRLKEAESLPRLGREACTELREALDFDNALLSFIEDDGFVVEESHHGFGGPTVIARRECMPEADCIRLRQTIQTKAGEIPATDGYGELLGATEYLVAPVIAKAQVVALLHVTRSSRGGVSVGDNDVLDAFASAYSLLYERMMNSERVQHQRVSIARAAARLSEEADRIASAAINLAGGHDDGVETPTMAADSALVSNLSDRERQVFERLILGASNADIADELVITVETVKTHVKRILRKIGAINRSEAIALYLDDAQHASRRNRR